MKRKRHKLLPIAVLLLALSSCVLAKGTYYSEKKMINGIAIEDKEKSAYFIYPIKTKNEKQIFNQINVSFANSRISYAFGESSLVMKVSLSKDLLFSNDVVSMEQKITPEKSYTNLSFDFEDQTNDILMLKAHQLYIKVEINVDANDETFDSSWFVLGEMNISGGEKLETEEIEMNTYFQYDFKNATLEGLIENDGLVVSSSGIASENFLGEAYFVIKVQPKETMNQLQTLKLIMPDSKMKSYVKEDGTIIHTSIEVYVATSLDSFLEQPSITLKSGEDEKDIQDLEMNLTSTIEKITSSEIWIKVNLKAEEDLFNPEEYLTIGEILVEGQEGQRIDSYLKKNFKEENVEDAIEINGFSFFKEREKQNKIILKDKGICNYELIEFDENGEVINQPQASVCTWKEKGLKYNNNIVVGMNEEALQKVLKTYKTIAKDGNSASYSGQITLQNQLINVFIHEVASNYYELVYDLVSTFNGNEVNTNIKKAATNDGKRFSKNVFEDYVMVGGGNVIEIIYDGRRELLIHNGKTMQRVTDNEMFKMK